MTSAHLGMCTVGEHLRLRAALTARHLGRHKLVQDAGVALRGGLQT